MDTKYLNNTKIYESAKYLHTFTDNFLIPNFLTVYKVHTTRSDHKNTYKYCMDQGFAHTDQHTKTNTRIFFVMVLINGLGTIAYWYNQSSSI